MPGEFAAKSIGPQEPGLHVSETDAYKIVLQNLGQWFRRYMRT